ncbi:MAG: DNA polymerase III subunit alpha, partial [Planctomycetes bacterium]|nr:DNA polymerase III subunit alpha [Planctomycetota bacterium]
MQPGTANRLANDRKVAGRRMRLEGAGVTGGDEITPLHVRSGYSFLRGAAPPERLIGHARRMGLTHLALTDVDGLYGATFFAKEAVAAGIRPIIGAELRCGSSGAVLLVVSDKGYENLCRLITRKHRGEQYSIEWAAADLAELAGGLHVITEDTCLAGALLAGGGCSRRLWLGIDPATQDRAAVRRLADFSRRFSVPLVATAKAMFPEAGDLEVVRLLEAIRTRSTCDAVKAEQLPSPRAFLRSSRSLARELAEFPEAQANNRRVAEECGAYRFLPRKTVLPAWRSTDGISPVEELARLCGLGLRRRYGANVPDGAEARLRRELRMIDRKGFSTYFLIVRDIVRYARARGAPVAARGSGASSLAAYLLDITNVCPLTFNIPFERFLNENRTDMPDLDIDFCWRIRDEIIDHVFHRYGKDRTAMVCMHNTFRERSAFRETARALGRHDGDISRMIAGGGCENLSDKSGDTPETRRIRRMACRLLGLPHNISVHPGGVVIAPKPIDRYTPVERAAKGVMVTQYDKRGVADAGLVKLDLLGNRSLSTIRFTCDLIGRRHGVRIDVESLPAADEAVVDLLRRADTVGCNQIESPAMRRLLRAIRPEGPRDLMQALALIRPGAASMGMKDTFIRRRLGLEATPQSFGGIDQVLGDTFGVMLYEDDVMTAAAALMGTSPAEGDSFRRAIQKCRSDADRAELSCRFLERCRQNGVD